jgi:signal peptidase
LLFMTVAPRIFGYTTATMLTGSMVPTINPGDVILDTREPRADIAVGQIISYHIPVEDRRVESHRVVWVHHDKDGTVKFRTKGDANTAPDPWTAKVSTPDVWRVRAVLPFVGTAIRALREPIVHTLLAIALPALLVVGLLVTIWKPSPAAANNGAEGNESAEPAAEDEATEDGAPAEDGDTADDGPSAGRSRRRWRR